MVVNGRVVFPHQCPVCKKYNFTAPFEECQVCNWMFDIVQEEEPNLRKCANIMSCNEAKQAYNEGKEIY